jgi:hypothetical protein
MIEITSIAKTGGPLTKRISLAQDGSLKSDGSACVMTCGTAQRLPLDGRTKPSPSVRCGPICQVASR